MRFPSEPREKALTSRERIELQIELRMQEVLQMRLDLIEKEGIISEKRLEIEQLVKEAEMEDRTEKAAKTLEVKE